jgi:hypothetical protein
LIKKEEITMIRVESVRDVDANGRAVLDLQVSTVAELPTLNNLLPGSSRYIVAAGSIAQVVQTGAWYTLDENGQWYFSGGVNPEEG